MEPRMCLTVHNPPRSYGDCIRACIATLTDDDQVPHVFDKREPEESWHQIRSYLKSKGKFLYLTGVEDLVVEFTENNPDMPYMLICEVKGGGDHVMVCKNGKVIHDPAYYKKEIVGPPSAGKSTGKYVIGIIGNLV